MNKNKFSQQLSNLKQKKQLMVILVFLFVVVIAWTTVGLFSSQHKVAISKDLREISKPLTPTLNEKTLVKLEAKRFFDDQELKDFPIFKVVSTKDGKISKLVEISSEVETLDIPDVPKPTKKPSLFPTPLPSESLSNTNLDEER